MVERFYIYRGFEIGLHPHRVVTAPQSSVSSNAPRFYCEVRIRQVGSADVPVTFTLEPGVNLSFEDEIDVVVKSCYIAERHIDLHFARRRTAVDVFRFAEGTQKVLCI